MCYRQIVSGIQYIACLCIIAVGSFLGNTAQGQTAINGTLWGGTNTTTAAGATNYTPLPAATSPGTAAVTVSQWNRGSVTYNAGANRFNSTAWFVSGVLNAPAAYSNTKYVYFTVTNSSTTELKITSISIPHGQVSATGPKAFGLLYKIGTGSVQKFGADSAAGPSPGFTGTAYLCPGQVATFYLCGWGYSNSASGGTYSPDNGTANNGPTITASYVTGVSFGTSTANTPVCSGTALNLTGGTLTGAVAPLSYSWSGPGYSSTSQSPSISSATTAAAGTYTFSVTDAYTCVYTNTVSVAVTATPTITGTPTTTAVCASTNTTVAANVTGTTTAYAWQRSTAAVPATFSTISSGTMDAGVTYSGYNSAATLTLTSPQTTVNGYNYRLIATNGSCSVTSTAATITVNTCGGNSINTTTAGFGPFCNTSSNNISVAYTSTGSFTGTFSVQLSDAAGSFASPTTIGSGTSPITATIPSGLIGGNYLVRVVNDAPATNGSDNGSNITIFAPTVGGSVSGSQAICSGATPASLTLTGNTGSIVKWQSSADAAFTSPTDISTTANPLPGATIGAIGSTAYYRAVVQNGNCAATNAASATITVNALPTMGSITGLPATLCTGTPASLTCTPNSGGTYSWSSSNTATATINASTGVANAVLDGTTNIAYSYTNTATGCTNTTSVTASVASSPTAVTATPAATVLPCGANAVLMTANGGGVVSRTATFSSGTISVAMATGTAAGTSNISTTIPAGAVVTGVTVTFNVASTGYYADLLFNLKAPNGQILNLFDYTNSGPGSTGGFSNIVVGSSGTVAFSSSTAPTSANVYLPAGYSAVGPTGFQSGSGITFSSLYSTPSGTWTFIGNDSYSGTAATLTGWSIALTYTFPVTYTWSPNGAGSGLYTNSGATTTYAATSTTTVYALPATGTSATYTVTAANNGCVSTATAAVTANVCTGATITSNPVDAYICAGGSTTFTVAATGVPAPTYQWQRKSPSGSFADITSASFDGSGIDYGTGYNTATLTVSNAAAAFNGYAYRCVATNASGSDTSNAAVCNVVASVPTTPATPTGTLNLVAGNATGLSTTTTGATGYLWQRATAAAPTVFNTITNTAMDAGVTYAGYNTSATLSLTVNSIAVDGYAYQVVASNACGFSSASPAATITVNNAPAAIISWDFSGIVSSTTWPATPFLTSTGSGYLDAHLTSSTGGLVRGSSITATGTTAGGCYGGSGGWTSAPTTATSENAGFTFQFAPVSGTYVSANTINSATRHSASGPTGCSIYYSIDGGTSYSSAGTWTTTSTSGTGSANTLDISSISALQNVVGTNGIRIKIIPSGTTTGTWYLGGGLSLVGTVNCRTPVAYNVTGGSCTGSNITLSGSDTWCSYQLKVDGANVGSPVAGTGSTLTFSSTSTPGTYSILATNTVSGCAKTATMNGAVVKSAYPATPVISMSAGSSPCCYGGAVTWSTFPVAGATYQWYEDGVATGTGSTFTTLPTLATGSHIYSVAITSSAGCTTGSGTTTSLTVDPAVSLGTIAATADPLCAGSVIDLTETGSPVAPTIGSMVYTWSGPAGTVSTTGSLTSASIASVTATSSDYTGVYTLSATFSEWGCTADPVVSGAVTVNEVPVVASLSASDPAICLSGSFTLTASVDASVGTITGYRWWGPMLVTNTTTDGSSPTLAVTPASTLESGLYTVVATASGIGCTSLPAVINVSVNPTPVPVITAPADVCLGSSIILSGASSTNAVSYSWSGADLSATSGVTVSVTPVAATSAPVTYSLTVSGGSGSGCSPATIYTTNILVDYLPVYSVSATPDRVCAGGPVLVDGATSGSTATSGEPASFSWTGPDGFVSSLISGIATPTASAVYTLTITSGACVQTVTTQPVTVDPIPVFTVSATPAGLCAGGILTLNVAATGIPVIGATTYIWSGPGGYASTLTELPGTSIFTATSTSYSGIYTLTGVFDELNCGATATTASVTVSDQPTVSVTLAHPDYLCVGDQQVVTAGFTGGSGTPVYSWSGPGITGSTSGGANTYSVTPGHEQGVYTVGLSFSGGAGCNTVSAVSSNFSSYDYPVWLGNTSNDWTDATNWLCGNIPSASDSVLILSGRPNGAVLAAGTGSTKTLQLAPGAIISVSAGATLNVTGNLVNNGVVAGAGLLNFNGSTPQAILGNGTVANIQFSNAAGDSIGVAGSVPDSMTVTGQMTVQSGNFNTNGRLIIYNTTDAVARPVFGKIGTIGAGASVTGKVIMQQYLTLSHRAYLFWGHPFSDSVDLTQLERYIDITGSYGSGHGFTPTASNAPSAYWYDTHHSNSNASTGDPGWVPFNWCIDTFVHATGRYSSGDTNLIHPYQGFRWYFRGYKTEGLTSTPNPDPAVVRQWGHINQGDVNVPLQRGPQSAVYQAYNQVANPYPSPVDIGAVLNRAASSGYLLQNHFFVWYAGGAAAGMFRNYDLSVTPSYVIDENTSFQIQSAVPDGSQSLQFHESDKAAAPTEILLKANPGQLSLNIYDSAYHIWDMFAMKFGDDNSDEFEFADGGKPVNPDLNFYSWSTDHVALSDDRRPFANDKIVPMGITSNYRQHFILRVDNYDAPDGGQVYLHDKYLGTYTLLSQGTEYGFDITKDAASQGDNRFELGLRTGATVAQTTGDLQVLMVPNPATSGVYISFSAPAATTTTLRLLTTEGVCLLTRQLGEQPAGSIDLALGNLPAGVYLVEVTSGKSRLVQRLVKE